MVFAFDTLAYARKLRDASLPTEQAEAHAEAAREFIMTELVTRTDLEVVRRDLEKDIAALREDLIGTKRDLQEDMASLRRELTATMSHIEMRIVVRLGGMLAVTIAILAAIIKL